ncbi:MAG: H-type small acid-soluble spore protein [Clostridia bacterium]|nr:H-type small acid-soluble spore protein [Clostridia bacterium]
MDTESAMEIIGSPSEIRVLYNNDPVWIQGVNGDIARVKFLETGAEGEVPVHDLVEADDRKKQ